MMEEEEEDTLFDQEGLLGRRDEAVSEKKEFKRKLLKTAVLSMSFFCLGLCIAIPGPTLLDLGKRVNRSIEHMTFIFTARSVGYLIGSLTGGVLFDFFDQQILLFYTISAVAVATASIPWCTALITLSALVSVQGVGLGVLDTGGNIFCIKIWTQKSAPFMQALHFAFGIGAFLAPLMARPFLVDPAVLSDNITKVDYYPVNFKFPSLESVSGHSRAVRGFHHNAYWDIDYTVDHEPKHSPLTFQHSQIDSDRELLDRYFTNPIIADVVSQQSKHHQNTVNDVGQILVNPTNHNTSQLDETKNNSSVSQKYFDIQLNSRHNGDLTNRRDVEDILFRYRREEADLLDAPNGTGTGNNTQEFGDIGETNTTVLPTPTTTTLRPIKPIFSGGSGLNEQLADSEKISNKLKDILNNPPSENLKNAAEIVPAEDTKDLDLNKTSSLVNTTVASIDTDSPSGNDTHLIEETTTASTVSTAAAALTVSTTTADLTVSTTTADSTVSTTTADSTVSTTTEDSTVSTTTADSTVSTTTADLTVGTTTADSTVSTTTADSTVSTTTEDSTVSTTTADSTVSTTTAPSTTTSAPTASMTSSATTVKPTTTLTSNASVATTTVASPSTTRLTSEPTTNSAALATKPFEAVDDWSTVNTSTGKNTSTRSEDDDLLSHVFAAVIGMSKIQIAYSLIGMLLAVNAGLFLFLYCKDRAHSSPAMTRSHEDMTRPPDTRCFISLLIILLFLFFFTYVGMEVTFGGLLTTFAVYYPMERWTPSTAAVLTALFWGCLAMGRCFAIFIARCFKPPCMMVSNLCLTVLGAVILSFLVQVSPAMLWIGTVTLGLGMSSLFPTAISWANSYYPLTGRATAIFVAGSGIGEMVVPVLTGFLFEKVNRMSLMYVTLTLSILMSLVYLSLQLVVYQRDKTSTRRSHSGFMRLNNFEDMNDAVDMDTVEFAEGGTTDITETTMARPHREEEEERQKNGDTYKTTEFTRLVELSD